MTITPLHEKVVIKRLEESNKTASGIIIPDNSSSKPSQGEVISIGTGYRTMTGETIPLHVKVGDQVLFEKGSGVAVDQNGEELLVMKEDNILGVLNK